MNTAQETEEQAKKLRPLLKHTFENSGHSVVVYSGKSDKVFPYLKEIFENEHWLYWCDYGAREAASHVKDLLDKAPTTTSHLTGVDFDEFMIDLAQELETFPPDIGTLPDAAHFQADKDLEAFREKDWFKALTAE